MYGESVAEGVPSDRMIEAVAASTRSLTRCHVTMTLELENALLPNDLAFSLALVANELLTNAAKYGCNENQGTVRVSFRHAPGEVVLTVADDGPGFIVPAGGRASTGLGLVRGLCRQIGGRLEIASHAGGTTARVFLPLRDAADDAD
jgi:two-component sensor histidine kinase